ncbi:lytic polysaccharide monooxygenase auxiliary activity family 9 protein [Actinomadura rudentiformis]|uniref:Chitin-binding protein n=1 Tax=Actinomadura rudentiformis TaxID=359158 RepID=A0A6H9Y758_9ACTN|nr:lytic polysaccharide monooxygenase [Actinomadura rudentiformis]KAB2339648.1 chitin-binding protein [Actinomadura rudentiformis]
MRTRSKVALVTATLPVSAIVAVVLPAAPASAHGTMSDPPSRVYVCKQEGPENPKSNACKAAVAAGGTQAFYDWNEVSLLEAGGRHRQLIPDGKLCSAGREKYRGLDLVRTDWPAKRISAGPLRLTYHASAPHANSNFEFYITRAGWSPSQPLRWSDLVHIQTFNNQNPTTFTNWTINIPSRTGRHLIYSIWQRVVGSNEAFYTCSDVDFGGGNEPAPPPSTPPPNTPPPATPPPSGTGTWTASTAYRAGDQVTYQGTTYRCLQPHTAISGWEPPNTPALWQAA